MQKYNSLLINEKDVQYLLPISLETIYIQYKGFYPPFRQRLKNMNCNMKSIYSAAVIALAASAFSLLGSGHANAQNSCTATGYTYDASCDGNADQAGSTVTASSTVVTAANATAGLVMNRVSSFRASGSAPGSNNAGKGTLNLLGFGSGAAAGEQSNDRMGLWINGNYTRVIGSLTGADFDSRLYSGMLGVDFRPTKNSLIGVGFGYEESDTDTEFNRGNVDATGYTVTPYVSIGIDDHVSLDLVGGYSRLEYDIDRLDPLTSSKITGSTDSNRYFGSLNLVVDYDVSNVLLGFRMGTSYVSEKQDAYTESDSTTEKAQKVTVGSGNVGLRIGYNGGSVQPYLGGTYSYDYNDSGGTYDGRNTFGVNAGLNISITSGVFFNLEGSASASDDVKSASGNGTMRFGINF